MSHRLIKGARPGEMGVIARMTTAEERAGSPMVRSAPGEGLELIRELIKERGRRQEFDHQSDAPHDDVQWDAPSPDE